LDTVAHKRGCLTRGGIIDRDRAARLILDDFRRGALGRITLEKTEPARQ
jgi:ribosome biogenesis GTPase A